MGFVQMWDSRARRREGRAGWGGGILPAGTPAPGVCAGERRVRTGAGAGGHAAVSNNGTATPIGTTALANGIAAVSKCMDTMPNFWTAMITGIAAWLVNYNSAAR